MTHELSRLQRIFEDAEGALRWTEVARVLSFWLKVMKCETTPLKPRDKIDTASYARAIAEATSRPVQEVRLASRTSPVPRPAWMTAAAYKDIFLNGLGISLGDSVEVPLGIVLRDKFRDQLTQSGATRLLGDAFGPDLREILQGSLGENRPWGPGGDVILICAYDSFWDSLRRSIDLSLWGCPDYIHKDTCSFRLEVNLGITLGICLACAITGNRVGFRVCASLLRAQEGTLGLGFMKDDPTIFIALCT